MRLASDMTGFSRMGKHLTAVIVCAICACAQDSPLLSNRDALTLYKRTVQLMESTAVAVPELARAGAPVTENARQALLNLEKGVNDHTGHTYNFLLNLKAYLALADSVPKPFPFPDEARKQFAELRESQARAESHFAALLEAKETRLRSPDRDNLRRYAEANAKLGSPVPGRPRVVFLGDSITDAWRLNEYFPDRDFVNRGISGQITGEMLGRMKADVIDLKPTAVLVLAGTNDLARGVAIEAIQNNLWMIASLAVANNIKPMFASILPVSDYHKNVNPQFERTPLRPPEKIRALNAWLAGLCRQRGFTYVDYYDGIVDSSGFLKAELADDGLHPNSDGYRIMAPVALAAIDRTVPAGAEKKRRKR